MYRRSSSSTPYVILGLAAVSVGIVLFSASGRMLGSTMSAKGVQRTRMMPNFFRQGKNAGKFAVNAVDPAATQQVKDLDGLFKNHKMWRESVVERDPTFFERGGKGQWPKYFWIGCADSRVPENEICGMLPGEIFTIRNVANQVSQTDLAVTSALQFGVGALNIPHIIVCGHYGCGGVKASMANMDGGGLGSPLENWLSQIRDVYRLHKDVLDSIEDTEARTRRLVELNVIEQCLNVFKTAQVQKKRMETYMNPDKYDFQYPRVHAMVYDPATGELNRLRVDLAAYLDQYKDIYDLGYSVEKATADAGAAEEASPQLGILIRKLEALEADIKGLKSDDQKIEDAVKKETQKILAKSS